MPAPPPADDTPPALCRPSCCRVLLVALAGSLLLWAAQPPLGFSLLAWIAPVAWLTLAAGPAVGRGGYWQIWLAGFVYWLLALHWIRLAHPATIFGLILLAGYLAVYLPLFVATVRLGHVRFRLPLWLVAPVVWVAVEWLQAHLLGGFLMGAVGHTQIEHLPLVQIADLGGAYLVSALVVLVAACLYEGGAAVARRGLAAWTQVAVAGAIATLAVGSSLWYGQRQLQALTPAEDAPTRTIALVQGSERAVWTSDPDRDRRVMDRYLALSDQARSMAQAAGETLDLVVWPESMFRSVMFTYEPGFELPAGSESTAAEVAQFALSDLATFVAEVQAPVLVGIDRQHASRGQGGDDAVPRYEFYNSAVAVARDGTLIGTYDKTHLVMFGEYVPGGTLWPGIYQFFPIGGLTPGSEPRSFAIDDVRYMPTICYETVLPHVVRNQVAQLRDQDERPDVLVNVTNDSWFNDSSELAMHLTCSRLRAIECRTPLVVAANGGLSAHVDRCGRAVQVAEPMAEQVLLAEVRPGGATSFYLWQGDLLAVGCLIATAALAIIGGVDRWRHPRRG